MRTRRTTAGATAAPAVVLACAAAALACAVLLGGCAGGQPDSASPVAGASVATSAPDAPESEPDPPPTVLPNRASAPDVPLTDAALPATPTAAPAAPVRVEVASLGIDVTVEAAGLDSGGALALPADPGVASWYRFGPSPWSPAGETVIAAHVDSLEYGLGSFARLTDAPSGTPVTVTAADGRVATFTVQAVATADKGGIDWAQVFDRTGPVRLALITCGGEFDYDTGHYRSNVIVTAVPAA